MNRDAAQVVAEVMGRERLRLVASLIRLTGDWGLAEDAVADAAERGLTNWAAHGVPDNPAAWLTVASRNRALDVLRRASMERSKLAEAAMLESPADPPRHDIGDDRLRLIFTCCHPALPMEGRVALTLKVVCGLSMPAVARAFLTSEATIGQRILRAKQKIANAAIPYQVPAADALPDRLDGVLAVIYLVFTEGWAADADPALAVEAIRLARLMLTLIPASDDVRNLLALVLLQHSRRAARVVDGELVTLERQDRSAWDAAAIAEAHALLAHGSGPRTGYRIQAELAAVHADAASAQDTDWPAIVALYAELLDLQPSPVVALNRAVAIGLADGPLAGLAELDALAAEPVLHDYLPWHAARGELLARAGRKADAVAAFGRARSLTRTEQERRQLDERLAELG
ncbi:MAG: RNA polymerase subunit sigma-24 [Actinomycetota bacterium]|nr:RNA polymerase subunit sigma-24 [Actinomycetota bacterium]